MINKNIVLLRKRLNALLQEGLENGVEPSVIGLILEVALNEAEQMAVREINKEEQQQQQQEMENQFPEETFPCSEE